MIIHWMRSALIILLLSACTVFSQVTDIPLQDTVILLQDKIEGLLIGSAIGDAAGGPLEFVSPPEKSYWTTTGERLTDEGLQELARALQPDGSWENFEQAMRTVDPFSYNETLYVKRELVKWLDLSHEFVERSGGSVSRLFTILENELQAVYWWEAWVPVVIVMAVAEIADYHPLASMQIIMEFGHDTDSYAQVMGAILGAIHGKDVFPGSMRDAVNQQMKEQFGQDVHDWMELIIRYQFSSVP